MCLHVGLPVQVRDKALKIHDEIPKSDVGKEYYQQNLEREVTTSDIVSSTNVIISGSDAVQVPSINAFD